MFNKVLDFYDGDEISALKFFTTSIKLFKGKTPMELIEDGRQQEVKDWIQKNMHDINEAHRGQIMSLRYVVKHKNSRGQGHYTREIHFSSDFGNGIAHKFVFRSPQQGLMEGFVSAMVNNEKDFEQEVTAAISNKIYKFMINQLGYDIRNGEITK